jgi:Zn finger protein HypA/HybF involved in hydrogenase expression
MLSMEVKFINNTPQCPYCLSDTETTASTMSNLYGCTKCKHTFTIIWSLVDGYTYSQLFDLNKNNLFTRRMARTRSITPPCARNPTPPPSLSQAPQAPHPPQPPSLFSLELTITEKITVMGTYLKSLMWCKECGSRTIYQVKQCEHCQNHDQRYYYS